MNLGARFWKGEKTHDSSKTLGVSLLLAVAAISAAVVVFERPTKAQRTGKQSAVSAPMAVVLDDTVQIAVFNTSDKTIRVEPRLLNAISGTRLDTWDPVNLGPGKGMTWSLTAAGTGEIVGVLRVQAAREAARRVTASLQVIDVDGHTQSFEDITRSLGLG